MKRRSSFARLAETDSVRADLKQRSVRGALFVASGGAIDFLLRFISIAILARLLAPEDFGLIAMVTAVTAVVDGVKDLGLPTATMQRSDITDRQATNLFWVNAVSGGGFALLLCALAPAIASYYRESRLVGITMAMSTALVWSGLSVQHEALMSRQIKQGELAFIRVAANCLSIMVAVALALRGWGYWALVWREVVRSVVLAVGVWLRCPWLPGRPGRDAGTRGLLRFGRDLSLTYLLASLVANIDRLLIGRFYGPSPVGMYRQAQQLLLVPVEQLNTPIMGVAQPGLSALQREPDRYRRYYEKVTFLVTLATVPLGLFVTVYAREVTLLLLGPAWSGAVVFVRIFGVAAAIRPAVATSAIVLITRGESARYLWVAVIHSVVLTVFLLFGVRWGAEGIAVAHVATTVVLMVPKLYWSFARTPVTVGLFLGAVGAPVVAGAVMTLGLLALRNLMPLAGVVYPLIAGAGVGGTLYAAAWLAQPRGRRQFTALANDLQFLLERRPILAG